MAHDPTRVTNRPAAPAVAHVLYLDLVGSELLPAEQQRAAYEELTGLVRETPELQRATARGEVICRPSGDGMALVFLVNLEAPLCCALELASVLRSRPHLRLRMGIHTGEVQWVRDINGIDDVTGEGIITAKRVMDCGDAGHILVSSATVEAAEKIRAWAEMLHYLGVCEVKHGRKLALWSLATPEIGSRRAPALLVNQLAEQTLASAKPAGAGPVPITLVVVVSALIAVLVFTGALSPLTLIALVLAVGAFAFYAARPRK